MLRDVVTCTIPRGARRIEPAAFRRRDQLLSRVLCACVQNGAGAADTQLVTAAHKYKHDGAQWRRLWRERAWPGALAFTSHIMHTDTQGAPVLKVAGLGMWSDTQRAA